MILYGAPVREEIKRRLTKKIKKLSKKPILVIIQVGDRDDSNIYIKKKEEFGKEIGVEVKIKKWKEEKKKKLKEEEVIKEIIKLNKDKNVNGIIVQLPLPKGLDTKKILQSIDIDKDADGLRELKEKKENGVLITPATAKAVMALLDFYKIKIKGKKVAVIGQSILAGGPISNELEKNRAEVFRCDTKTKNIPKIAKKCDILISAAGKAGLITKEFVNRNQTVIDVGINRINGKLMGDVTFEEVMPIVKAITPVPGGIGPLTVACLFENLLDLCYHNS